MQCKVDTSGLRAAIDERLKYPGRTEAEAVNHAAYSIAHNAMMHTPFVVQDKIDTQLGVAVALRINKNGKLSKRQNKRNFIAAAMGEKQDSTTLAKLIVLARANLLKKGRQSKYNKLTNNRWKIDPEVLKGGKAVIDGFISRMIKKRHSSTKFLVAGWLAAKKALAGYVKKRIASPVQYASDGLGGATPAREGKWNCQASIENDVGMEGVNAESYNKALILHGQPALQYAVDAETENLKQYIAKLHDEQNAKFNRMAR